MGHRDQRKPEGGVQLHQAASRTMLVSAVERSSTSHRGRADGERGPGELLGVKGGVIALTKTCARSLLAQHHGERHRSGFYPHGNDEKLNEEAKKKLAEMIPLTRLGEAEDIAKAPSFSAARMLPTSQGRSWRSTVECICKGYCKIAPFSQYSGKCAFFTIQSFQLHRRLTSWQISRQR